MWWRVLVAVGYCDNRKTGGNDCDGVVIVFFSTVGLPALWKTHDPELPSLQPSKPN